MATTSSTRGSGFWFTIAAVLIIIVGGIWYFTSTNAADDGVGRDLDPAAATPLADTVEPGNPEPSLSAPEPIPGSPAATGTAGVPSGTAGEAPKPGDPTEAADTN